MSDNLIDPGESAWAIVSDLASSDSEIYVEWLLPTIDENPRLDLCPYLFKNSGDKWTVPKEDEWPDEVCAALAKWRLTQ